ncbi:hypothetical protein [Adlercreutzia shanghongiae]|uniref:Uncharacterized protein n=1 Tax=Adlercreutzia shanghongiae TaxID=3111773 RepID=A0ABU6IWA1_9ACTN|nr:hypothetical protein [Adlercreutzia sp. R22]MEC4294013.1 hypothetical protein [Adlercreutzia sp. R22]
MRKRLVAWAVCFVTAAAAAVVVIAMSNVIGVGEKTIGDAAFMLSLCCLLGLIDIEQRLSEGREEKAPKAIACPYGYGRCDARPGGAKPRGCPGRRDAGPPPIVRLRDSVEEVR